MICRTNVDITEEMMKTHGKNYFTKELKASDLKHLSVLFLFIESKIRL